MKTEIIWNVDAKNDRIRGPRYHDGDMLGYSYTYHENFTFKYKSTVGETLQVEFDGIHDCLIEMWNGAIILDITALKIKDTPESIWNTQDAGWNELFKHSYSFQDMDGKKAAAKRLIENVPEAYLAEISFSYGGSVTIVCDKISFFKIDETGSE